MIEKIRMNENVTALLKNENTTIKIEGKGEITWLKRSLKKLLSFILLK